MSCRSTRSRRLSRRLVGTPLAGVASELGLSPRDRGRFGKVVEMFLGMQPGDNRSEPDLDDGLEVKLVTVRKNRDGLYVAADKVQVTHTDDPISKLRNVLWVFADRDTGNRPVVDILIADLDDETERKLRTDIASENGGGRPVYLFKGTKGRGGRRKRYAWYLRSAYFREVLAVSDVLRRD